MKPSVLDAAAARPQPPRTDPGKAAAPAAAAPAPAPAAKPAERFKGDRQKPEKDWGIAPEKSSMNATKVVLLVTIVGLVGASGYLIWRKLNPSAATAVARKDEKKNQKPGEGEPKPGQPPEAGKEAPLKGAPSLEDEVQQLPPDLQEGDAELAHQGHPGKSAKQLPSPDLVAFPTEGEGQQEPPEVPQPVKHRGGRSLPPVNEDHAQELTSLDQPGDLQMVPAGDDMLADLPEDPGVEPMPVASQEEPTDLQPVGDTPTLANEEPQLPPRRGGGRPTPTSASSPRSLPESLPEQLEPTAAEPTDLEPIPQESVEPVENEVPQPATPGLPEFDEPEVQAGPTPVESPTPTHAPTPAAAGPKPRGSGSPPRYGDFDPVEEIAPESPLPRATVDPDSIEVTPRKAPGRATPNVPAHEPTRTGPTPARRPQSAAAGKGYTDEGTDPTSETYVVQPNDNFWTISKKVYGSSRYFQALQKYNSTAAKDPYNLRPGTKVETPSRDTLKSQYKELIDLNPSDLRSAPGRKGASAETEGSGMFFSQDGEPMYRVGDDDTLSGISQRHLGRASRWYEIYEKNQDVMPDTETLKPGMVLRLPTDASQAKVVGTP